MRGEARYGDAGIKDLTDNPEEPQIYIYDVGLCSLNCKVLHPLKTKFSDRKNGDGARHVKMHKEKKYQKDFTYGRNCKLKFLVLTLVQAVLMVTLAMSLKK